ncbi:uncharacterized protein LOC111695221 [Eurytemora carolleeae]|uniref:uncharacterized protein LOC111695221 n=1 Tax=Eurytemora carolleeae TaxID=1294199 RepID=UPI000C76292D|nr:uncharacterized protein LOC111695221 [Eurytemora carolleeae]|eukprot:XP_023320219.1 uncharacterized protein LOC111695221 [Eurytemora affinis]
MGNTYKLNVDMGTICDKFCTEKKKASPPHTLSELLSTVGFSEISEQNLNTELINNIWISRFVDYLRKRNLEDEETSLKFLILTQPLKAQYKKTGSYGTSIEQQRWIFSFICSYFLSEDSTNILALDNQALFNDLQATQASIQADLKVSSEALADLLRARDDLLIWEEGLEPVYFKFLQPYSTPHIATLLSIL